MVYAATALAMHLAAIPGAAIRNAQVAALVAPAPAAAPSLWASPETSRVPRWEVGAAFVLPLGTATTPGLAVRARVRLVAGLWAHAGASARGGSAPIDGGVREIPLELGLGYRVALGQYVSVGVRGYAVLMSRRMSVSGAEPRHRWLGALRGGAEVRVSVNEDLGMVLFAGAEGRLGRTEVSFGAAGNAVFSPVAPYFELGPSVYF